MQISTKVTGLVGAAAGVLMAVVAYQGISSVTEPVPPGTAPVSTAQAPVSPSGTGLAECAPPARVVKGTCVTYVERTVVVYDAPARAAGGRVRASGDDSGEYEDNPEDEPDVREDDVNEVDSATEVDSFEDEGEPETQEDD